MTKDNYFQISTAIDYPSGRFHLGHAYEKICADVIARWKRLQKNKVHFSTGTDCHGSKIERAAKESGKEPSKFVQEISDGFKDLCKKLNISHNDFIQTTETRHKKVAQHIIKKLEENGDIYKGNYEGPYCVDCETYYTEKDLDNNNCPIHKKPVEILKEESYFFKLGKYQDFLIEHLEKNPRTLWPEKKRKEILNRLKEPLNDLSISRKDVKWGIPLPFDENLTEFVWVEALNNYLTTIGYPDNKFKDFWPATHVIGSDIVWHHTVIWFAILKSLRLELPEVIVHGFINLKGEKLSKAANLRVDPIELAETYSPDALRYFLLREIPFGDDGDFSEEALLARLNNELANDLGNLVSRVLTLAEKNFNSKIKSSEIDKDLSSKLNLKIINDKFKDLELHNVLNEIWKFINECNRYVNEKEIWKLEGEDLENKLYNLLESIRIVSILLSPFLPETSGKIFSQLGVKCENLEEAKFHLIEEYSINKSEVLFKKIEKKEIKEPKIEEKKMANFTDIELRVGKIEAVKDHPNADKLYIILVDLGEFNADKSLQIVSGLKLAYKKEELLNKKIIVITNLENSVIRGVESSGMLLAIEDDKGTLSLLTADKSVLGSKVYTDQPDVKEKKEIKFNEFKSIQLKTKNSKIYYQELPLKTDKEEIFIDKNMPDGLIVE